MSVVSVHCKTDEERTLEYKCRIWQWLLEDPPWLNDTIEDGDTEKIAWFEMCNAASLVGLICHVLGHFVLELQVSF